MYGRTVILGRLGQDPEVRQAQNGTVCANFSVAVDAGKGKDGKKLTEWYRCVAFGKTAELIAQHTGKGLRVLIEGEQVTNQWKGKDGGKHTSVQTKVWRVVFVDWKEDGGAPEKDPGDADDFYDDDLPW